MPHRTESPNAFDSPTNRDHLMSALHDLGGFVQVVLSNAEILEQLFGNELEEESKRVPVSRRAINSILESARGAGELIHGVLAPDSSEFQSCKLDEVILRLSVIADSWDVAIKVPSALPNIGLALRGDALLRVLLNLIKNTLETECANPSWTLEVQELGDKQVVLRVFDNGPGIKAARLERIFDPGISGHGAGRGWGLFSSRVLLRAVGGDIRGVAPTQGGAQFELQIPRALSAELGRSV